MPAAADVLSDQAPSPALPFATSIESFARILPVQTSAVARFDSETMLRCLTAVAVEFPRVTGVREPSATAVRVRDLYGVDPTLLGPACGLAWMPEAGAVLFCQTVAQPSPPQGCSRWVDGDVTGFTVRRGETEVSVAVIGGHVAIGAPAMVQRMIAVARDAWPSLTDAESRWRPVLESVAGADSIGSVGIFFPDPSAAPWCRTGCTATAVFANPTGEGLLVAAAQPGLVEVVRSGVSAFWDGIVKPFERLRDVEEGERPVFVRDATIKRADLPVRTAELAVREDRVIFQARGDVLMLAAVVRTDLIGLLLGARP